jgi:hypothetical protein
MDPHKFSTGMASFYRSLTGAIAEVAKQAGGQDVIPEGWSFTHWCEELGRNGLKVDGHPFTLDDRPALRRLYDRIPGTLDEAYRFMLVVQKGAQMGMTIWEILASIYLALRFGPATVGLFLPNRDLASYKSSERFVPIVKSIPDLYTMMTVEDVDGKAKNKGEGNVLTRKIGVARFLFLWTSGKVTTESIPMDILSFDEVQEMTPDDIDKTRERLSASHIRLVLLLSTANWPDADINFWYQLGTQEEFETECPSCGVFDVLDKAWPKCIKLDTEADHYRYCCPSCGGWIDEPQQGRWVERNPGARFISSHYSQILSPNVSPDEIADAWHRAATSEQKKNFYNRKLGRPYSDPSQIPVSLDILRQCAEEGKRVGLSWKASAKGAYMGIDQMGNFNVVIIKERLPDNRQAVIHVEAIYDADPFARCDYLMRLYGVQVCCVETLPNYNDAKRFANRHRGKVFLAGYSDLKDDMLAWGDANYSRAEKKINRDEQDRYTVTLNQYKCMSVSQHRFVRRMCLFPDPDGITQDTLIKGEMRKTAICRDEVFLHLCRIALITEEDPDTRKKRAVVKKVGIDPHFAYANMLCDVAWARAHGTTQFLLPDAATPAGEAQALLQGRLPDAVAAMLQAATPGTCGACNAFKDGVCTERLGLGVNASDFGCEMFIPA